MWRAGWLGEQRAASFCFGMFERFTEPARHVLELAQDEARSLRHHYVGSEHVLLALLRAEEGVAANVLNDLGITPEQVRDAVPIGGASPEVMEGQLRLTPRAKMALELAVREGLAFGDCYVGTAHILVALTRVSDGGRRGSYSTWVSTRRGSEARSCACDPPPMAAGKRALGKNLSLPARCPSGPGAQLRYGLPP